jgi:hypothetical protein
MPKFVADLLRATYYNHNGSYEIQFVLDAIIRHQNYSCNIEYANDVEIPKVLKAVEDLKILSTYEMNRFKMLFDNHLPILSGHMHNESDKTDHRIQFYRPWHSFKDQYLCKGKLENK